MIRHMAWRTTARRPLPAPCYTLSPPIRCTPCPPAPKAAKQCCLSVLRPTTPTTATTPHRLEAERRAEEEAAKRSARDNASERALRQMMGGTLAGKGGAEGGGDAFSAPRPGWMAAMGVEPDTVSLKALTEEQVGGVGRGGGGREPTRSRGGGWGGGSRLGKVLAQEDQGGGERAAMGCPW